jgi:hypothetical protein
MVTIEVNARIRHVAADKRTNDLSHRKPILQHPSSGRQRR